MKAQLRIKHSDGSESTHPMAGARLVVGTGPDADVALPDARDLEAQHLLLAPREEGCWVGVVSGARTPAVIGDVIHTDGVVPWGTTIAIGALRVSVERDADAKEGLGRAPILAAMIVVAVVALLAVRSRSAAASLEEMEDFTPSPLFDAEVPCALADGQDALSRGRELLRAGQARGERFHYDYQDGIAAVRSFEEARSCFVAAGAAPWVERTDAAEGALRADVERTYRSLRLRLAQSFDAGRQEVALDVTRQLRELTAHRDDAYTRGLAELERNLSLEIQLLTDASEG